MQRTHRGGQGSFLQVWSPSCKHDYEEISPSTPFHFPWSFRAAREQLVGRCVGTCDGPNSGTGEGAVAAGNRRASSPRGAGGTWGRFCSSKVPLGAQKPAQWFPFSNTFPQVTLLLVLHFVPSVKRRRCHCQETQGQRAP